MKPEDFKKYGINKFTPEEIERTGAKLSDVKVDTMIRLNKFRIISGRRVYLVLNGLTTGNHKSPEHPDGKAVDGYYHPADGDVDYKSIFYKGLESGFKGIGIYYNKENDLYTFHLDTGRFRCWGAYKEKKHLKWNYFSLLVDPKSLLFGADSGAE